MRRSEAHQLETQSMRAFASRLPAAWTAERVVHDYGLDMRVEIFDTDGTSTGLVFYAQLKATNRANLSAALTVRFQQAHFDYWHSHSDPVLLVLWHAPSSKCFTQWAHHNHPYAAGLPEAKTWTARFALEQEWAYDTPLAIREEVEYLRRIGRGATMPIVLNVARSSKRRLKASKYNRMLSEVRNAVPSTLLRLTDGGQRPGVGNLYLGRNYVEAQVGSVTMSFFVASIDSSASSTPEALTDADVISAVGLAAAAAGAGSTAIPLLRLSGAESKCLAASLSSWFAASALLRLSRWDIVLELAESWSTSSDTVFSKGSLALIGLLYTRLPFLEPPEAERLRALTPESMRSVIPGFLGTMVDGLLAMSRFDEALVLSEYLFSIAQDDEAKADAGILLAKSHLGLSNYDDAAYCYQVVLSQRPKDDLAKLGLGDSLLLSGRYAFAVLCYGAIVDPAMHGQRRLRQLLAGVAAGVRADAGSEPTHERVNRNVRKAEEISARISVETDRDEVLRASMEAMEADAVSVATWRLHYMLSIDDVGDSPFRPIAAAIYALLIRNDVELWAVALHEAYRKYSPEIIVMTLEAALEIHGDAVVDEVQRWSRRGDGWVGASLKTIKVAWTLKHDGCWFDHERACIEDRENGVMIAGRPDPVMLENIYNEVDLSTLDFVLAPQSVIQA